MHVIAFVLLVIASTCAGSPPRRERREVNATTETCVPDTTFKDYCNTCFCSSDGILAHSACTLMGCDPNVWNKNGTLKNPSKAPEGLLSRKVREVVKEAESCELGKSFKHYCNTCHCVKIGQDKMVACTLMFCHPEVWNKDGSRKISANDASSRNERSTEERCEPGKSFMVLCNTCFCADDGKVKNSVCTEMFCGPSNSSRNESDRNVHEISNEYPLRARRQTGDRCAPGRSFKHYCNSCRCGSDGTVENSACTLMYCDPDIWNKDGSRKNATEIANNFLRRLKREVGDSCEPGENFKHYCNTCLCPRDGIVDNAICTMMYCNPDVWNQDGSKKNLDGIINVSLTRARRQSDESCEPGKEFFYYCNSCYCGVDGKVRSAVCTSMRCPEGFYNKDDTLMLLAEGATTNGLERSRRSIEFLCQPGKSFNQDCNLCYCNNDGRSAVCTLKLCDPQVTYPAPQVCEPGKQFKIDCNQCTCTQDGLAIACTDMECPSAE